MLLCDLKSAAQVEDGEDLMENMDADYVPIAELDQYDPALLDRREYGDMDYDQRQEAERVMRERDQALGGRLGGILDEVTRDTQLCDLCCCCALLLRVAAPIVYQKRELALWL
jgi:Mini-chromosome maintenance protein 2